MYKIIQIDHGFAVTWPKEEFTPEGDTSFEEPEPILAPVDATVLESVNDGPIMGQEWQTQLPPNTPDLKSTRQHLVFIKAVLARTSNVFDEHMYRAIRRGQVQSDKLNPLTATVTMDFPPEGLVDHEFRNRQKQSCIPCYSFILGLEGSPK